jgi:hypothetical protein
LVDKVKAFWTQNRGPKFDKGEKIDFQNLKIYKHPLAENLASGPDWLFAPVLVAKNQEQINITRQKCSLWAKVHKTYVFKWKANQTKIVNPASPTLLTDIEEHNVFCWQYFVQGTSGVLKVDGDFRVPGRHSGRVNRTFFGRWEV